MQALRILEGPAYEPVSLNEAKRWLLVDDDITAHDGVIRMLIRAMREHAENLTHRAFIRRTYRLYLDRWPLDARYGVKITLPRPPLVSVNAFKYTDTGGSVRNMEEERYVVHATHEPGFIIPAWGYTWPTIRQVPDAIRVDFTAGYEPGSPDDEAGHQEAMPAVLKQWMEARIGSLFENRETIITGTIVAQLPRDFADGMLDSLVVGTRLF